MHQRKASDMQTILAAAMQFYRGPSNDDIVRKLESIRNK